MRPRDLPAMRDNGRAPGPDRRAYTLLELLIVAVLVSVMMLGVWSLFRTWGDLYECGGLRMAQAQLVRSLCDQFTDDVLAVAYVAPLPDSPARNRPGHLAGRTDAGGPTPRRRILRSQAAPIGCAGSAPNGRSVSRSGRRRAPFRARGPEPGTPCAELRDVLYSFVPEEPVPGTASPHS